MKLKDMPCIPTKIVAELLNKSEQYIRMGLQQERLPFGTAVKTSSQWSYHISYNLLKDYIGEDIIQKYEEKNPNLSTNQSF